MRWFLAFAATTLTLAAGAWYTTTHPPSEGSMECHGVNRGNRCIQFPADPRVTKLVAVMPVVRHYRPLTSVRCYSKDTLAVCTGMLKHGHFGVGFARFRVHQDGTVTPICPKKPGGTHTTSVFCID
jgi:hypothetical protein